MYNLQAYKYKNGSTNILFAILLAAFFSIISLNSHSQEIDIEINAGCEPIVVALMFHPGFRLGASAQYVWAAGGNSKYDSRS